MKKEKQPVPLTAPDTLPHPSWVIFGLDLSLSRTGFCLGHVTTSSEGVTYTPLHIGSFKPDTSSAPVWLRSSLVARAILEELQSEKVKQLFEAGAGLLISVEAFTPRNDFLSSINRIVHATLFSHTSPLRDIPSYVLSVNASTLRSLMGLTKTGASNKKENIAKAYTYVDRETFPELDTDSCDAVLLSVVGSYAATALLGMFETVPEKFRVSLGSAVQEVKGKGSRMRIQTKGLFHRPEYWYAVQGHLSVELLKKDASLKAKKLLRSGISL